LRQGAGRPSAEPLSLLGIQEAQEGCVLRKEVLDLGDTCAGPVLEPAVGEIVFDAMEAAFAHGEMIDTGTHTCHGPFGSTWRP
jgi:hypothetical protein